MSRVADMVRVEALQIGDIVLETVRDQGDGGEAERAAQTLERVGLAAKHRYCLGGRRLAPLDALDQPPQRLQGVPGIIQEIATKGLNDLI